GNSNAGAAAALAQDSANRSWDTYYGNSAHNRTLPHRGSVGVLRWSQPINLLLYGPGVENLTGSMANMINQNDGTPVQDVPTLNYQLIAHEGYFYLSDSNMIAAYPVTNPIPGRPSQQGNERMVWPQEESAGVTLFRKHLQNLSQGGGMRQHPY